MALPSFLGECISIQNPILLAFSLKVILDHDYRHTKRDVTGLGLKIKRKGTMIDPAVLKKYGGKEISLKKEDVLFRESEEALNYFQIIRGSIKMITNNAEGKEFIQGIFRSKDSFGEPPLFGSFPYPSTAIALESTSLIKLTKDKFFQLLKENFEIHLNLDRILCQRLKYKSMVLSEISSYDPEHRIMSLLKYIKGGARPSVTSWSIQSGDAFIVPYTRQQLADMSGLRVETVIRTVKKMEDEGKLKVISRKIAI